jgi:5-methylcytosine-specific restriction endonuclease McrA
MSGRPSQANRARILRALVARDGLACFYCGNPFASVLDATIDHLIPRSVLPGWQQFNLVLACFACNNAKADTLPQVFLPRAAAFGARRAASRRRTRLALAA